MVNFDYDCSGWATKANTKCYDGLTIAEDAFKGCSGQTVPLVYNHDHNSLDNVLGHALLENRKGGVYAYAKFNDTPTGQTAKKCVENGDLNAFSIWANGLQKAGQVVKHGVIRELSLVLAGCNPGALIQEVVKHSADNMDDEGCEAFIFNDPGSLSLEHGMDPEGNPLEEAVLAHSDDNKEDGKMAEETNGKTLEEVYNSMTDEQKECCHALVGLALEEQDGDGGEDEEDESDMKHNVFDKDAGKQTVLKHSIDDINNIIKGAKTSGTLKAAFDNAGVEQGEIDELSHGIDNIDWLFPEDHLLDTTPRIIDKPDDWVSVVMGGVKHIPFSRFKSMFADLTPEDARAKGYVKGNYKIEEVFGLLRRSTGPTTVYKKQKLDRDDVNDITNFDVVSWLRNEMRYKLNRELALAYMDAIGKVTGSVHEAFTEIFPPTSGEQIHSIAEGLDLMTKKLIITDESAANLKQTFKGIFAVVKVPLTAMTTLAKTGARAFGVLVDVLRPVGAVLLKVAGNMGSFVSEMQSTLLGSGTLSEKLEAIAKSAKKLLDPLTTLGDVLKKSIGEKLSEARKEISKWADSLPDGVREGVYTLLGILEGLGAGTLTVAGVVGGALSDLKKSVNKAIGTVADFITGQSKHLNGYKDVLTSLPAIVGAAVSAFAEEFKGAAGNVESAASRVYEPVKAFFKALKDGFDSISGTDIYRFLSLLDVGLLSYAIAQFAKAMNSLRKMLATPLSKMLDSISGSFNALTGALKTWQKQENTKILTGIGSALLMLAGAMFIMSRINPERFVWVLSATVVLIAELVTAAKLLKPEVKAFDSAVSGLGTQLLKASTLWGSAAALLGLAAATKALCSGFVAIADTIKGENFIQNLAAFAAAVGGMYVLTRNMGMLIATVKARDLVVGGKTLLGIGAAIIEMGVAMRIVAGAVEPLSKIPYTSLFKATAALAAMASILTAMGAALVLFQAASDTMLTFQNGLAIAAMGGGLWVLVQGVCALAGLITENVDDGTLNTTKLEYATTAMKTLMILMTAMSVLSSKTKFSSGAAALAMAGAMNAVAVAAAALTLVPVDSLKKATGVLGGLSAAMAALGYFGSAGWSEGAGIFLMADALMAVAGACLMMGKVDWGELKKAGASLVVLSAIGLVLSKFAGPVSFLNVSTGMLAMSASLLVLAPAIQLIGMAKPEAVSQSLWIFADTMMAMFAGGMLLTCIPELALGLSTLAAAFTKFGKGMLYLAGAGAIFGTLALFADPLCTAIINAAPDIEDALVAVVTLICNAINECAEPIGEAFTTLCKVLIQTAIDLIGWAWSGEGGEGDGIKGALEELGKNIWDGIRDIFSPFSDNGNFQQRNVAFKFNPDFKPQRINVADVFTFSGAKDDAEKEGKEIGENVANGGAKGVEENKARATGAVQDMVDDTIDTAKKGYDVNSPSKVFEEIGRYITEGLAIGIQDPGALSGALAAIQTVAKSVRIVFTTFWGIHSPSQLAEEDGRNVVEGLRLGIGDPDLRSQLYDASYESASQVRDAVGAALDEAKKTASDKMLELYDIMRQKQTFGLSSGTGGYTVGGVEVPYKAGASKDLFYDTQYKAAKAAQEAAEKDAKEDARNTPYLGADWKPSSMWDKATEALQKYQSGEIKAKDALKGLTGEAKDWVSKQIGSALGLEGLDPSEYADLILEQYSGYLPDDSTGASTASSGKKSSSKGKTLAETIAEKYTKELKSNKYLQNAADKEYSLWEAGEGDTASIEELIEKKGETLAKSIELQTARVDIAQRQYDELVSRVGASDDKTKEAYSTLLDEKKNLLDLQQARFENTYKAAIERYESDDKLAQSEYQLWADTYEKTASVTEKSNKNIETINKRLAIQSEKTALAEKAWVETKDALGEASLVTQQAYRDYLEARQEQLELENELDKAQLAAFDDLSSFYDSRISMAQKRMTLLDKLYNDGDLSGREDAYASAVEQYGEDSIEARRAATQGTMTALMGVNSALTSMRWQMSKVTAMQQKYQTALEQAGGNRYDETVMAAYEDMMETRSTFADYVGNLADAFNVSDATKKAMMQFGDAIAQNWKPIQNGFIQNLRQQI